MPNPDRIHRWGCQSALHIACAKGRGGLAGLGMMVARNRNYGPRVFEHDHANDRPESAQESAEDIVVGETSRSADAHVKIAGSLTHRRAEPNGSVLTAGQTPHSLPPFMLPSAGAPASKTSIIFAYQPDLVVDHVGMIQDDFIVGKSKITPCFY